MSQEINACDKVHHYGMHSFTGRGAPEIDIIEAMQGDKQKLPNTNITRPYQSCSLQVAPGVERDRPELGLLPKEVRLRLCLVVSLATGNVLLAHDVLLCYRDTGTRGWNTTIAMQHFQN